MRVGGLGPAPRALRELGTGPEAHVRQAPWTEHLPSPLCGQVALWGHLHAPRLDTHPGHFKKKQLAVPCAGLEDVCGTRRLIGAASRSTAEWVGTVRGLLVATLAGKHRSLPASSALRTGEV